MKKSVSGKTVTKKAAASKVVRNAVKQVCRFKRKKGHEYLQGDKLEYGIVESTWPHPSKANRVFILVKNTELEPDSFTLYSMRTDCHCGATTARFIPPQIMQSIVEYFEAQAVLVRPRRKSANEQK